MTVGQAIYQAWLESLPCPHGRPTWRMCPHCLEINILQAERDWWVQK